MVTTPAGAEIHLRQQTRVRLIALGFPTKSRYEATYNRLLLDSPRTPAA